MSKTIMSPDHHDWDEFAFRLQRHLAEGACTGKSDRPYTTTILKAMGTIDVEGSLEYFESFGGNCDCEVLLNVALRPSRITWLARQ